MKSSKNRNRNLAKTKNNILNRLYKDSVFKHLFGHHENRENLLSLYNALNDSNYTNKDDLRINTIDGILYMSFRNDISFILDSQLVLYEHQSTYTPNMPLRGLAYFAALYQKEIFDIKTIYSSKRIKIPTPKFVVFYNGLDKDIPDRIVQRLSDSFEKPADSNDFEWTATILNINYGHNKEILLKCRVLEEYSLFVKSVRKYLTNGKNQKTAIRKAIEECIENNILRDFLTKSKAEVATMLYEKFDAQREWEKLSKEFIDIGRESRQAEVDAANKRADEEKASRIMMIRNMLSNGLTKENIIKITGITEETYATLMQGN